jgi:hypothetical protein
LRSTAASPRSNHSQVAGSCNVTGPHTHIQYDLNGSNDTSWYSGYTSKGEAVDRAETLGYLD